MPKIKKSTIKKINNFELRGVLDFQGFPTFKSLKYETPYSNLKVILCRKHLAEKLHPDQLPTLDFFLIFPGCPFLREYSCAHLYYVSKGRATWQKVQAEECWCWVPEKNLKQRKILKVYVCLVNN